MGKRTQENRYHFYGRRLKLINSIRSPQST